MVLGGQFARAETVTFWVSETEPSFTRGTEFLLNAFMALNPDITVTLVPLEEGRIIDRLRDAWRGGREPQVLLAPVEDLLALAPEGMLDPVFAGQIMDDIGRDRFYRGPRALLEDELAGGVLGIPYYAWLQGIWYRRDWLAEAGLERPTNLFEVLAAARALQDPERGRYGLLMGTTGDGYTTQVFSQIATAMGVRLIDPREGLTLNTPEMVRALAMYRDLARTGPPGEMTPVGRDYYFQNRLGMMFYSTHLMDDLALSEDAAISLTGDNFADLDGAVFDPMLLVNTGMIPSFYDSSVAAYGVAMALAMPYPASRRAAAATRRLVRFLFRDDVIINWMHKAPGGMMPALRGIAEREGFLRDPKGVFARWGRETIAEIIEALDETRSLALVDGVPDRDAARLLSSGLVGEMVRKVVRDDVSPEAAAAWAQRAGRLALYGEDYRSVPIH